MNGALPTTNNELATDPFQLVGGLSDASSLTRLSVRPSVRLLAVCLSSGRAHESGARD